MDKTFEENRRRPDDPDFEYDVEVDFEQKLETPCGWDDESDNEF